MSDSKQLVHYDNSYLPTADEAGTLRIAKTLGLVVKQRTWKDEPDGPNDRPVDIWYNNKWVPAFFSDILKGDFYLVLDVNLEPGKCFFAASDCVAQQGDKMKYGFVIVQGSEIVQAPKIQEVDITPKLESTTQLPRLENK